METFIKDFRQLTKEDVSDAGGKWASLWEMTQLEIAVPEGFVILSWVYEKFLKVNNLNAEINSILDTIDLKEVNSIKNASKSIQTMILSKKIEKDVTDQILQSYKKLNCRFVAVRSSATWEDSVSYSWAGQLDSFLNVTEKTLIKNVIKCFASLFTPRAIFYRFEKWLHRDKNSVAVVIQKMVNSEKSGIAFSAHPHTHNTDQIVIEASFGLGEAIVAWEIIPDNYLVRKRDLTIWNINISTQGKEQVLSVKEILRLSKIIIEIENHYWFPCDIEWAQEEDSFYIVQSRPISTFNHKKESPKIKQSELFKTQISLTEWFKQIDHKDTNEIRVEDNEKRERLRILNKIIGLPFDKPTQFPATELTNKTKNVTDFIKEHAEESCALRLIPTKKWLEKFRMRGMSVEEVFTEWYPQQKINSEDYRAEFLSNSSQYNWSTIFVLHEQGIFGEIIRDGPFVLTQWFYNTEKPITFHYDWHTWSLEHNDAEAKKHLKTLISKLKVNKVEQVNIQKEMSAEFSHGFLAGYFETVDTELGIEFIDYSATLGKMFSQKNTKQLTGLLNGQLFGTGIISGTVRIIRDVNEDFTQWDILVCEMTTPEHIELMKKSSAIITDKGWILSHAAIIAREMGKICIVGTESATTLLQDRDILEINANTGTIHILNTKK